MLMTGNKSTECILGGEKSETAPAGAARNANCLISSDDSFSSGTPT